MILTVQKLGGEGLAKEVAPFSNCDFAPTAIDRYTYINLPRHRQPLMLNVVFFPRSNCRVSVPFIIVNSPSRNAQTHSSVTSILLSSHALSLFYYSYNGPCEKNAKHKLSR